MSVANDQQAARRHALAGVSARIAAVVPALQAQDAVVLLGQAKAATGKALRELDEHLSANHDCLTSGDSRCPLALIRLTHALQAAGYDGIRPPACAGCGK